MYVNGPKPDPDKLGLVRRSTGIRESVHFTDFPAFLFEQLLTENQAIMLSTPIQPRGFDPWGTMNYTMGH
jgi:hypothetical protein